MSGVLGEGLLGDFILGDDSGDFTGAQAQAQAYILGIPNKFAQAQSDILQIYQAYGQAQVDIKQIYQEYAQTQGYIAVSYQGYGQAQATIPGKRFAQAQADILQTYYGFSQAQAGINQTYYGFSQAQVDIKVTSRGFAQAQGIISRVVNTFSQAKAFITNTTPSGQSQADIKQTYYSFGQPQGKIKLIGQGYAQALAYVRDTPVGLAAALIDSPIKNNSAQAQAFICWIDDFTRTTTHGLGSSRFVWNADVSDFDSEAESTYKVDGSKVIDTSNFFPFDSYIVSPIPRTGQVSFDIFITAQSASTVGFEVTFGDFNSFWIGYFENSSSDLIQVYTYGKSYTFVPERGNWYSFKTSYFETGEQLSKVWKRGDTEPDWQIFDNLTDYPETNITPDSATINFFFAPNNALDNFQFCTIDATAFRSRPSQMAQAQAVIYRSERYGQAQAQIVNTTANGLAQAYIEWIQASLTFDDPFTRTTSFGLGTPYYLWDAAESDVDHPAVTEVYVDGSTVVIPPNFNDAYRLNISLPRRGRIQLDAIFNEIASSDSGYIRVTINASGGPIVLQLGRAPVPTGLDNLYWYYGLNNGITLFGGGLTPTLGTSYTFSFAWSELGWGVLFGETGSIGPSTANSSWGGSTPNFEGTTNPLIELVGGLTAAVNLSKLVIDSKSYALAQAAALINSPIKNKSGQARARVMYRRYSFGQSNAQIDPTRKKYGAARALIKIVGIKSAQAGALLNTGLKTAQAQALIGSALTQGYAQAQAHIFRRIVARGQARARIKVKRWVWAQAMAFIKPQLQYAQAQAQIFKVGFSHYGQAQAYIVGGFRVGQARAKITAVGSMQFGQAQAILNTAFKCGQARAFIASPFKVAQARARITAVNIGSGQALANILGAMRGSGHAQAWIKQRNTYATGQALAIIGSFKIGQAQAWINRTEPGYLVKYNNYLLPGYLQQETLMDEERLFTSEPDYSDFDNNEYLGLSNKVIDIRMLVVDSTYREAKEQIHVAGTMLRSSRTDFVRLTLKRPDRYYLAKTKTIRTEQEAGRGENKVEYSVTFEAKPWAYGITTYTLTGTIDTDDVGRTLSNGTWTPAIVRVTGTNITVSGYTDTENFTGFISVSGTVSDLIINSETYTATMNGVNRNDLINNLDYQMYIGPGRTRFTTTGITEITVEYEDRWPL